MRGKSFIVADAGGTKTEWAIFNSSDFVIHYVSTAGINASVSSEEHIRKTLLDFVAKSKNFVVEKDEYYLYFYGAGCNSSSSESRIIRNLDIINHIRFTEKEFYSDLTGAARALFGDRRGIACILGTGSASGVYNGRLINDSISSLGYILGDEGSGAYMGKILINWLFKRNLSDKVKALLEDSYNLDLSEIMEHVYRRPGANTFLASFVPFLKKYENEEEISRIIDTSLKLFFDNNVLKYKYNSGETLGFVGSVAFIFKDRIKEIASEFGFENVKFIKQPLKDLVDYYIQK